MAVFSGALALPKESNVYYVIMKALPGVRTEDLQKHLDEIIDIADFLRDEEMNFFLGCQKFEIDNTLMVVFYWEYCDDAVPMDPLFKEKYHQTLELLEPNPFYMGTELVWGNEREILYSKGI